MFKSYGHYGSTVFDPASDREFLEVTVCDKCLVEQKARVLHYTVVRYGRQVTESRPWRMTEEEEAAWQALMRENG